MTRPAAGLALLGVAWAAWAAIPEMTSAGVPLFRTDALAIQVLLNTSFRAGTTNANGQVLIPAGSDPAQAAAAAVAEWNGLPGVLLNFLPVQSTTLTNDHADGKFVVTIQDTAAIRSVVGASTLAITAYSYNDADGKILDSDILFNPNLTVNGTFYQFSTTRANGSFDLQSVLVHELGHALGASHTPVIGATMYQSQGPFSANTLAAEQTLHQALSADDVAFASTRYPGPTFAAQFGTITGQVAFSTGGAVAGALVVAVDAAKGTTIGGLASMTDGRYQLDSVPPGSYRVFAQPANGPVTKANLSNIPNVSLANTSFRVTFAGGNTAPSAVPVTAGQTSAADISVDPAAAGMQVGFLGKGTAGGTDWTAADGPKAAVSGTSMDLLLWGAGLNSSVTADQIRLLGPGIAMRAGTLRTQTTQSVAGNTTALRFTVDLAASAATVPVTIAVVKGTDAAVYSGGLVILGSAPGCTYTVSSKLFPVPSSGGQGTVTVTAGSACAWTATSEASWLSIASTTAASGNGAVTFTADANSSPVTRSATLTVAGQAIVVNQAGAATGMVPEISAVVNGASFQPGIEAGSWVTIQGTNLANTNPGRTWQADEIVAGRLPTSLDGVGVTVNGKAAYVYYISPKQLNVQAPADSATGAVNVVVTNNGATSSPATAQLQAAAPAFFQYSGTSYAIATLTDYTLVGNPSAIPGTVAAARGGVLILWGTGFGPTNPATVTGNVVSGAPAVATLPVVTVGGTQVDVLNAVLSPGSAGLYQIAIQLPATLPTGIAEIRAGVGGYTSPAGVSLLVQ